MQYRSKVQLLSLLFISVGVAASTDAADSQDALSAVPNLATPLESVQKAIDWYEPRVPGHSWQPLRVNRLTYPGQRRQEVVEIRRRLSVLGDHPPLLSHQASSIFYDDELEQALKRFQFRHGLKVDGIIGPNTRQALSVSPRWRLQQLRLNAHRLRQFHNQAPGQYLLVNIPAYRLYVKEQGRTVLSMKTIVGRKDRPTPVLSSQLETLVVNPDWNVPRGIAYKDIVPELKRDEGVLKKKGLQLVQGYGRSPKMISLQQLDWQRLYLGPPDGQQRFWQAPGQTNPLGNLKFSFPNQFTVYMHGTPDRALFEEPIRTFSSGCIRIEQPRLLASYLLRQQESWPAGRLEQLIDGQRTRHFRLPWQPALFLVYWTAWVEDGVVHFRRDIYNRDRAEYLQHFPQASAVP